MDGYNREEWCPISANPQPKESEQNGTFSEI